MFVEFIGANNETLKGEVILTEFQLKRLAKRMKKIDEFAYDTETNTLRVQYSGEMNLVGISISFGEQDNYYIPTGHYFDENQLQVDTVVKYLKPIFERQDVRIICQNLKFDMHVLENIGIKIKTKDIFDTMIARWITDENKEKGLKGMTSEIYGVAQSKFDECLKSVTNEEKKAYGLKSNNKAPFQLVRIAVGAPYAIADAYWTWRHYCDWQLDEIVNEEMETIFYKVQMPFLRTLYNMERRGVKIDTKRLSEMRAKAEKDLGELMYDMVEIAGVEFNPASTQQVAELLFNYKKVNKKGEFAGNIDILDKTFNFPINSTTDGGAPSTSESALKALSKVTYKKDSRKSDGIKLVKLLLKYKKLNKLKSAFIEGLLKQAYKDGKVHPSFNQVGCLTEETLIPTDNGIFPIGELADLGKDGDFIEKELNIVNRYRELEPTKYVVKYLDRDTIKLTTVLGMEIEGTLNHPLIVNKYGSNEMTNNINGCRLRELYKGAEEWKKLEDITTNDYVAVPINYNTFAREKIRFDNKVVQSQNTSSKEVTIPEVLDEDLAEFMGIYYADGSIHDGKGSWGIRITNGSMDVIDRVQYLSKKLFNVKASTKLEPHKNSATTFITALNLKPIEELLEMKRGAVNKVIPKNILKSPKSVIIAFLKGLTLDSSIIREGKKDYLKYTTSNEISARYIQEILLNIGIVSSRRQDKSKTNNVFHVCIYNKDLEKFSKIVGFVEKNKYIENIQDINRNHYRVDGDTLWVKVKEIKRGKANVYDFNVPNTHSFISGAFISHNTDSGRLSCSEPNLQQLPRAIEMPTEPKLEWFDGDTKAYEVAYKAYSIEKEEADFWKFYEIRDVFIPDEEDESIIAIDFDNLEMKLLAHFSQDEGLVQAFIKGLDAHGDTAVRMFNLDCTDKEVKKKYPHLRQIAKTLNFGLMYGMSAFSLYNTLLDQEAVDENGDPITKEKAQEYYDKYFEAYSGVDEFISNQKKFAHRHGMVFTLIGRKRRLPDINSKDYKIVGYQERLSVNSCIQGSGGDIMMLCQPKIEEDKRLKEMNCRMILQVHDELVFICPDEHIEDAIAIIKGYMEHALPQELNVPITASSDSGKTYAEAK